MRKKFSNKNDLINWLKKSTSAALLSISLVGGVQEIRYQASSVRALFEISQFSPDYLRDGAYVVECEDTSNEDESDDLVYTNIATAFTFKGRLARHPGKIIGGMDSLKGALVGYQYTAKVELEKAGYIGHLLVLMPKSPEGLESLESILHNLSVAYIIPDGGGNINQVNFKMGRGLWV